MALRDIIARFGVQIDGKEQLAEISKLADKGKLSLQDLAAASFLVVEGAEMAFDALQGFGSMTLQVTNMASHAEENLAGLRATFEQNAAGVVQWSLDTAKALGRSEYALQEYALRFGAFLQPVFAGTQRDVAGMSQALSQLALDLASFYDTTEEEAMMRLFSGMSGETEAVRRLGIDISDAALDAFNKSRGDDRRMMALSLAEKSFLRYEKILQDTQKKQGDVVRSQGRWADSVKRMVALWDKFQIILGQQIMPKMMSLGEMALGFLQSTIEIVQKTTTMDALFYTIAGSVAAAAYAMGAFAVSAVGAEAAIATITSAMKPLALMALAFLTIEDVLTTLKGGDGVLGRFLKWATGMEEPMAALSLAWKGFNQDLKNTWEVMKAIGALIRGMGKLALFPLMAISGGKRGDWGKDYQDFVRGMKDDLSFQTNFDNSQQGFLGAWTQGVNVATNTGGQQGETSRSAYDARGDAWNEAIARNDLAGAVEFRMPGEGRQAAFDRAFRERAALVDQGAVVPEQLDYVNGTAGTSQGGMSSPAVADYSGSGGAPIVVPVQMSVDVTVQGGGDPDAIGQSVADHSEGMLREYSAAASEEFYSEGP